MPLTSDYGLSRCFIKVQIVTYLEHTSESSFINFKGYFGMPCILIVIRSHVLSVSEVGVQKDKIYACKQTS